MKCDTGILLDVDECYTTVCCMIQSKVKVNVKVKVTRTSEWNSSIFKLCLCHLQWELASD